MRIFAVIAAVVMMLAMAGPANAKKPVPAKYVSAVDVQNVTENYSVRDDETGQTYTFKRQVITVYFGANTSAKITSPSGAVTNLTSGIRFLPGEVGNYLVEFTADAGWTFRADQAAAEGLTVNGQVASKQEWVPFLA